MNFFRTTDTTIWKPGLRGRENRQTNQKQKQKQTNREREKCGHFGQEFYDFHLEHDEDPVVQNRQALLVFFVPCDQGPSMANSLEKFHNGNLLT